MRVLALCLPGRQLALHALRSLHRPLVADLRRLAALEELAPVSVHCHDGVSLVEINAHYELRPLAPCGLSVVTG